MNIGDYLWFIFKSKGTGVDARPINAHVSLPDWIDQYDYNSINSSRPTCFGLDMQANFLEVATTMQFNFRQIGVSFLDVFNGMTAAEIEAKYQEEMEAEEMAEEEMEEEEPEEEDEEEFDDGFLLTKLRQEEDDKETDCYQVNEDNELIYDEMGMPIPCEKEIYDPSKQEDFAVERGEFQFSWNYKEGFNHDITNLLQYPGFSFEWPLVNFCTPAMDSTRAFWMVALDAFRSGQWGNKEFYATA